MVSKTKPGKCPYCGSTEIEQDPDVLDTWFSSWLWPFSTFGWPFEQKTEERREKTETEKQKKEFEYFYPTSCLVTAQEIIFFWVARMIMAGMEFIGEVPFRHVYIHGTVRDSTGTKMSKSLGNIIDPLDMIEKYGTDALRFSIISITAQGQDVFLSEGRFELGRNFANKIWNASRFILMNLKREDIKVDLCAFFRTIDLSLPERWILSRLYSLLSYVTKSLDEYKFNEAAGAIYEFFWHEFCDWYVEIAKLSIEKSSTQVILYKVLEKSLRMLHPFMPFVTEEVWQNLPREGDSIMAGQWPHVQDQMISKDADKKMRYLIEVVCAFRNIRAFWNMEPKKDISSIINIHDTKAGHEKLLSENTDFIKRLSKVSSLKIGEFPKPKNSAVSIVNDLQIYVPLEGIIDFEKESGRLKKEEEKIEGEIDIIGKRLKDKSFLSKAPLEIIDRERARKAGLAVQLKKIKDNLRCI